MVTPTTTIYEDGSMPTKIVKQIKTTKKIQTLTRMKRRILMGIWLRGKMKTIRRNSPMISLMMLIYLLKGIRIIRIRLINKHQMVRNKTMGKTSKLIKMIRRILKDKRTKQINNKSKAMNKNRNHQLSHSLQKTTKL